MSSIYRMSVVIFAISSFSVLFGSIAWATTVKPGDVKIVDGEVKQTLTVTPGDVERGRKLFFDRKLGNCLACHANKKLSQQSFHGEIGPPMDGVAERYSEPQLRAILIDAKKVFGDQTIMPAFYKVINDKRTRKEFHNKTIVNAQQIEDLIAYLKTLKE